MLFMRSDVPGSLRADVNADLTPPENWGISPRRPLPGPPQLTDVGVAFLAIAALREVRSLSAGAVVANCCCPNLARDAARASSSRMALDRSARSAAPPRTSETPFAPLNPRWIHLPTPAAVPAPAAPVPAPPT